MVVLWVLICAFNLTCLAAGPGKHALLIGVGDYSMSGLPSLQGPANDLPLIKRVLLEKFRFPETNITMLIDDMATHTGLQRAFSRLARQVKPGDFVYIHYCGHGSQVPDKDGDESPGLFDQTWVPYGSRSPSMEGKDRCDITDDELHLWLMPIFNKTEHVVFVSDSCHSGSVTRGDALTARTVPIDRRDYPSLSPSKTPGKKDFKGGIRIGASRDDGLAFEASFNRKTHGLLSWYWAGFLRQANPADTWGDIFKRTRILVNKHCDLQCPQFRGDPDQPVFANGIDRVWAEGQRVRIDAGKQYLFLIAIDHYRHWPALQGPVSEAGELKKVLVSRYHIDEIKELYDKQASKEAIRDYLTGLQEGGENQLRKNDSLFIYFSGHGQAFEGETWNGYWIPYDGGSDIDARAYWLGNSELIGLVNKIKANHILIVSDSCFAGTLVDAGRGITNWNGGGKYLQRMYNRRSRKVLTSGGLERVPGQSVFSRLLIDALNENQKPWIEMAAIYRVIKESVCNRTGNHPEYGNLRYTDFDPSASYILFTREAWEKLVEQKPAEPLFQLNLKLKLRINRGFFLNLNLNFSLD